MNKIACKCGNIFIPKQVFKNTMENVANPRSTITMGKYKIKYCICPNCYKIIDV